MARATAEAAAQTSRDVLEVASRLFSQRGYSAVSVAEVAAAAGVTRGAVYHHYRSKVGLFSAVAAHLQVGIADSVLAAAQAAGEKPSDQLRAGCQAFLEAITADPSARVLLLDAPAVFGWDQWRQLDRDNSVVHLREVLLALGIDRDLIEPMTAQLSGAMNESALWIAQHPEPARARRSAFRSLDRLLSAIIR